MPTEPLVVVPTYVRTPDDLAMTLDAVKSVEEAESKVDMVLVDDGSPERDLVDKLGEEIEGRARFVRKDENTGFSRTVNVGMRMALQEGRDVILMNADVEIMTPDWADRMVTTVDPDTGQPASVVGALLVYPNGLIQHGGIYFSILTRNFNERWKYSPMNLPDAHKLYHCPVTGALQFIRHECLTTVGLYDESFYMGWEDVDYCLRVFQSGRQCIFNPDVRAWHHESLFRGRPSPKVAEWQAKSWMRLAEKWNKVSFHDLVPAL